MINNRIRVTKIRDEYFDNDGKLSPSSLNSLKYYLEDENSEDLQGAINLVTDARLMHFAPLVGRHLEHTDQFIRSLTLGCLIRRMNCAEYAEKVFNMVFNDPEEEVRATAIRCLGSVLDRLAKALQQKIAQCIYDIIVDKENNNWCRRGAYDAINDAMKVPIPRQHSPGIKNFDHQIDYKFLEKFCEKYHVNNEKK